MHVSRCMRVLNAVDGTACSPHGCRTGLAVSTQLLALKMHLLLGSTMIQYFWCSLCVPDQVCAVPLRAVARLRAAAPSKDTPLFSAEYLADRELNRTGTAPDSLLKSMSSAKLSRSSSSQSSRSRAGSPTASGGDGAVKPHLTSTPVIAAIAGNGQAPAASAALAGSTHSEEVPSIEAKDAESLLVLPGVKRGAPTAASGRKGLALPFQPMSVAFKDISYFVELPAVGEGSAGPSQGGRGWGGRAGADG